MQNGDCNYLILEMTVKPGLVAALQAATKPMHPPGHFDDALYKYKCRYDYYAEETTLRE
jgi:hypothetical protein